MYIHTPDLSQSGRGSASWGRVFEMCFVIFLTGAFGIAGVCISYNMSKKKNPVAANVLQVNSLPIAAERSFLILSQYRSCMVLSDHSTRDCALQAADHAKSYGKNVKETAELLGNFGILDTVCAQVNSSNVNPINDGHELTLLTQDWCSKHPSP